AVGRAGTCSRVQARGVVTRGSGEQKNCRSQPLKATLRSRVRASSRISSRARDVDRPTLLMVGSGEPMDAALRLALDRHGLFVEAVGLDNLRRSVQLTAPDMVLLLGDAAEQG